MTDPTRRRIELGHELLAADAAGNRIRQDCHRHRIADDMTARAVAAHDRLHTRRAEEKIEHEALFGLLDSEFLALLRFALVEAGMRHAEEQGDEWFRVGARAEELVSALDHALTADVEAGRRAA